MLNSIDSLFAPVGTTLYSVIVTILVWPNASKTLWVNKSNLLLSKTPRNWHTPSMLAIGNVSAKGLAPTNQPPSPTIVPTTSPTGSPTATLNPPAATTIPTSPLPEPIPPVDASLIHETWYWSHKAYICIPGTAHHPKCSHIPMAARYTGGIYEAG